MTYSTEQIEKVSEGAGAACSRPNLAVAERHLFACLFCVAPGVGVWVPLGSEGQIIIHALMTELQVCVAPQRGNNLTLDNYLSDVLLSAANLARFVLGIDVVEMRTDWDCIQIVKVVLPG